MRFGMPIRLKIRIENRCVSEYRWSCANSMKRAMSMLYILKKKFSKHCCHKNVCLFRWNTYPRRKWEKRLINAPDWIDSLPLPASDVSVMYTHPQNKNRYITNTRTSLWNKGTRERKKNTRQQTINVRLRMCNPFTCFLLQFSVCKHTFFDI